MHPIWAETLKRLGYNTAHAKTIYDATQAWAARQYGLWITADDLTTQPLDIDLAPHAAAAPDEYVKARYRGPSSDYYHETNIGGGTGAYDVEVRYDRRKHRVERVVDRCDEDHETFKIVPK